MKIKKGDTVKIISGKDKGKTGKVLNVSAPKNKTTVEGLNIFKKHVKPKKQGEKGQIISVSRPTDISNVMVVCSACGKPARIGYHIEAKNKSRYCKNCKAIIK
ncbi:50S ribosomal protein L24 [Candidatus Wolfebacteria bacterium CG10_big_fil_rev_8_21_14_0_10_31_9]|uniref:Large ribosomal subunit protein uL24 n=1 Tax=Candidatus Wolfebacteria bacterium CG10_big_fil_rev_8_21_14_0_10_31_9 TaxID=1975070 RepID=A0A2H0RCD9_9BACT|nr:MAG: 50S ribosomal protein L24 [Candidatus Wolfebacteria bacterium CG10_big_fil_rev_8_21_14_0_10_31_9]